MARAASEAVAIWSIRIFGTFCIVGALILADNPIRSAASDTDPLVVSKISEVQLPPGISAFQMAVTPDGASAFIAGMGFDQVGNRITGSSLFLINAVDGTIRTSAAIPGPEPNRSITAMTFDSLRNRVFVAMSSDLFIFDGNDLRLLTNNFVWHRNLYSLFTDTTSHRLFGLARGSSATAPRVVELSPEDGSVIGEVNYSQDAGFGLGGLTYSVPRLAMDPTGSRLYALPAERPELLVIDPRSMSIITRIDVGTATGSLALSPTAQEIFVSDPVTGILGRFSMTDMRSLGTVPLGGRCPGAIALDSLGERAVVGHPCGGVQLSVFDPETSRSLSEPFSITSNGMSLWMSADGRRLYSLSSSGVAFEAFGIQTRTEARAEKRAAVPLPTEPRRIRATLSGTTVTISWDPPTNARKSKVSRYLITGKPGNVRCTVRAPKTECKISGLSRGRTYAFTVQGESRAGRGPAEVSDFVNVPDLQAPPPSAPAKPQPTFS